MATKQDQIETFREEIDIIQKEINFWFVQMQLIEQEWEKLEKIDALGLHNDKRDKLADKAAEIYKRMSNEMKLLVDFKERYNKSAKKNKWPLIE